MEVEKKVSHEIFINKKIIEKIFFEIANFNTNDKNTISQDLFQLLFVCKIWYKVSIPILYSKIIYNGGITRGVYQGTYTRLETIANFINNNKKLSIKFHIYNYLNGNNNGKNNSIIKDSQKTPFQMETTSENLLENLEFTENEKKSVNSVDPEILNKINRIINNINSLKINDSCNLPITNKYIYKIKEENKQIFNEISDNKSILLNILLINEILFRKILEGIDFLKVINDNLEAALSFDNTKTLENSLFVPNIYSKVRTFFFNKTDQFRTVDQLFSYKHSYLDFIGNCENLTILSFGSKHDKQHLLMEKDLLNLFSAHCFPHLKYLAFNNLQYITGENTFQVLPLNIEALRIDYCKNVTVDSIITLIRRIGYKLKLLSLKDSTITIELLNTIISCCKQLIYVDISYNKVEKDYVKKVFRMQVQNIIKLNKNLRVFNVYGILDLKNIQKTEQLYPQIKLYNNENLRSNNTTDSEYNSKIWYKYLENDLDISFKYRFDFPNPKQEFIEIEDNNEIIDFNTSDSEDMISEDSDILFI
ncbi:hypothetical protein BCR36DRAFT_580247 [Piromyces finnis]|uniref:Uncharacterized protein n=1 Tax=Piromyces finnis TaxID=1754191 RepID=A0A1Y1VKN8_9FUNG|nr:hypothetical protein BCR36DRAFT_580247 [Piromyces finnis]|eukprot:ORX58653.1 hypothetical protein BCR36DRAFT_580247 [Piromyces finnis]